MDDRAIHVFLATAGAGVAALGAWLLVIGGRRGAGAWREPGGWTASRASRLLGGSLLVLAGALMLIWGVAAAVGGTMGLLYL